MTVFVVHPIRQEDTSPALKWGQFRFINHDYVYGDELWPVLTEAIDSAPQWTIPPVQMSNLRKAAREYDPEQDYVMIAGDHLQLVALVAEIAGRHGKIRVLRFDRKISDYIPVQVQLDNAQGLVLGLGTDIGEMNGQDRDAGEEPAQSEELARSIELDIQQAELDRAFEGRESPKE